MRLRNIHMAGNEHGQLAKDTIYAALVDDEGNVVISATLQYILVAIRERGYQVQGVTIEYKQERGAMCSNVKLDLYQ